MNNIEEQLEDTIKELEEELEESKSIFNAVLAFELPGNLVQKIRQFIRPDTKVKQYKSNAKNKVKIICDSNEFLAWDDATKYLNSNPGNIKSVTAYCNPYKETVIAIIYESADNGV